MPRKLKRYGKKGWQVTYHAVKRWRERIDDTPRNMEGTRLDIVSAAKRGFLIPNRYAEQWVPRLRTNGVTQKQRRSGIRYLYTVNAIMVLSSKRCVVTVFAPDEADLASVLVWKMMNVWV